MAIVLDHTIVPAKDKVASAEFLAEIFGLKVNPGQEHFAQVQINGRRLPFRSRANQLALTGGYSS